MTKFAKKHLSRCVGLYLVGAVAIGAGVAVYDMPSAYAFSQGAYDTINGNLNGPTVGGMTIEAGKDASGKIDGYVIKFVNDDGTATSQTWVAKDKIEQDTLDLGKLQFDSRDNSLVIGIPDDMTLSASGKLDNGDKSPIIINSNAELQLKGDTDITGDIAVSSGKTLTVTATSGTTLTGQGAITNSGTIVTEGANITGDKIENVGEIKAGTGTSIGGKITNTGKIEANNATVAGIITNEGTMSLNNATVSGAITDGDKGGTVAVSGTVGGQGEISASKVSVTDNANLSGITNVSTSYLEIAGGKTIELGTNVKADTLDLKGTGENVTGTVSAGTISVSDAYQANDNLTLTPKAGEAVKIVVNTTDPTKAAEIASKQVAGLITAGSGEEVKVIVSTTDGSSNEIVLKTDGTGQLDTSAIEKLEEELKNDKFENPAVTPSDPSGGLTPAEQALISKSRGNAAYNVFSKTASDDFITKDDLKALQDIDLKHGTSHYKNAMRNLQKVVSPTIATRQSMNVLNSVSLGNVSDRLDSIRTARGHVGVYPEDGNVKGAREDKTGNLWASVKHGDTDIDGDDTANVKYNHFQIGYDHQVGDSTYIGAFVGTTTGDVTVNGMKSDIDSAWDFGLYGTRLLPQGQYFNLVGKYGKMTNKYRTAEWDNKGYNVALEYGQKIQQPAGFTITPYVQLVYDHASDSTVSGVYVPMYLDSSNAWNAKIGAKFEDEDAYGNNVYGGIAYSKGIGGSYTAMVNGIRLPDVDNDLGVIFINLGIQHKMSDSSYFDLRVEKEMLDYDGWNVQGVVNFAF